MMTMLRIAAFVASASWVLQALLLLVRPGAGLGGEAAIGTAAADAGAPPLWFAVIADLDKKTRGEKHWLNTVLKIGRLQAHAASPLADGADADEASAAAPATQFSIAWDREIPLRARHAHKSRGLELSDLSFWRGTLWSICDSTGILYRLVPTGGKGEVAVAAWGDSDGGDAAQMAGAFLDGSSGVDLVPTLITTDDGGTSALPAKNEWLAVYNDRLHIGGHGREWVDKGVIMGRGGEWVKIVDTVTVPTAAGEAHGEEELLTLSYRDWQGPYRAMRTALGASFPGYVSHEGAEWWDARQRWVFFPRKISAHGPYSDDADEIMGNTHRYVVADANFSHVEVRTVDYPDDRDFGVSALRAVPGHDDVFMVLRVIEQGETVATELDVVSLSTGESLLLPHDIDAGERPGIHVRLGDGSYAKFEGVEFLP